MTVAKKAATTVAKKKAAPKADQFVFIPKPNTYQDSQTFKDEAAVLKSIREGDINVNDYRLFRVGAEVELNVEFKEIKTFEKSVTLVK